MTKLCITTSRYCLPLCIACLVFPTCLTAAEIHLKAVCTAAGSLLVLGDVAEIYSTDDSETERLSALPLTPAPAPGKQRFLRSREIQDMLVARGVNVGELTFSGANQVTVETPVEKIVPVAPKPIERGPNTPPLQMVNEALMNYLKQATSTEQAWNIQFQLPTTTQQTLRKAVNAVSVSGGTSPWLGAQEFTLHIPTADGDVQFPLNVEVSVPHAVVAVVRAMPRGSILRAEDVKLVEQVANEQIVQVEEAFHTLEDVIGKETQKAISPGQVLDKNYVRSQILVRRGDVVTVYARAAGIRVRTTARALSDGSKGDLIAVETLETGSRDKFDARVTGAQVVEVWAGSIAAGK
jgi:flagellar basal body P-ring formation protein FlgA